MHLAIIIDEERLKQEQSMLNRLCIGLMAEGVQVTRIVPDTALPDAVDQFEQRIALATRIETPMRVLPWLRTSRTARVADLLERKVPDVFYAVGERAWSLGNELGSQMERPLLIDVSMPEHVRAAPRPQDRAPIAGYVACTPELAKAMGARIDPAMISVVPMGVSLPATPRSTPAAADRPIAVAMIGSGRDTKAYQVALDAMSRVSREAVALQVFLELRGPNEHELWRIAGQLDLLGIVTVIGDASLHRSLVIECDALLLPDATGEPRSIIIEAMAHGIPIVARQDGMLASLLNEESVLLFNGFDPAPIAQQLLNICRSPESGNRLGARGRTWVESHHRSSYQVQRLYMTLEQVLSGGAVRLNAASP
jgi:glycosyltransferase involved in cell wall biosynthesis